MVEDILLDKPPRKRARRESTHRKKDSSHQRLFAPFRALGLITNDVPFALETRSFKGATEGPRVHILTCLGKSWALWEGGKMTLLFVGPEVPDRITSLALHDNAVWISAGPHVVKYIRGKEVARMTSPFGTNIATVTIFGDNLLALTEDGSKLLVWSLDSEELSGTISFDPDFTATNMLHPATYINKILVASSQGSMQLWNIRTLTCIHKFRGGSLRDIADMNSPCAIASLVQSPAIDVVGIGFSSGEVILYDIRADERVMRIFMDGGGIRSLAFRSDGEPLLASSSSSGHIALWDLNSGGHLLHIIRGAHDSAVNAIEWVPGQPLLVSSGGDNSVKQWLSDSPTTLPRLLKFRSGHHEPPHLIRYYGEDGKQLLTASHDRSLRYTSIVRDSRSFELSQGHISKKATSLNISLTSLKFPPASSLSFSSARSKDWDDVLTCHGQEMFARTWSVREKKLGKWSLNVNVTDEGKGKAKKLKVSLGFAKTVCVTACGNFGLTGSSTGAIHMYNMQSGLKRKTFKLERTANKSSEVPSTMNERIVTGLATDALNRIVIASTQDGTINLFDFHTTSLECTISLPSGVGSTVLHRESGLLAAICDDHVVRLIDIETRRIVREMSGFRGRVLDVAFSPDARWLVIAAFDSIIRTFDIPTGRLIDAFRTPSIATSIAFSPTNDFLATAHIDSVGIYLWANRAQYADVSLQGVVDSDLTEVSLPSMHGETMEDEALEGLSSLTVEDSDDVYITPSQLDGDLVTLTLLPRDKWQTLLHLETIQQRNKPKEPPKPPAKVPFFLPTLPGVEHRFAVNTMPTDDERQSKKTKSSKKLDVGAAQVESMFYKKLISEDPEGDYESLFTYAKTLSPAAIDLELRSVVTLEGMSVFLNALSRRLRSHRDFEAVQAFLSVFLKIHGEELIENSEVRAALETLQEAQKHASSSVVELITSSRGALGFIRDVL